MSQTPVRVLHFADAHIDIANYGRYDPATALPVRVMDFLSSLDQIIDRAVFEPVDLVIFAGDAYKNRNPQPTFQREWGKRIMRLSTAGIPTILLIGNHDVSPAAGRANTLQEYKTLEVPNVFVASKIELLGPAVLGKPIQVITIPYISRSALLTRAEVAGKGIEELLNIIEDRVSDHIQRLIEQAEPDIPLILTAHASVHGAKYGSERSVMLGQELILSGSIVKDKRFDYIALGHIHKHQSLNGNNQPPIVYSGSIERIDFGEVKEEKGFVLVDVKRGETKWQFNKLNTRRFIDIAIETPSADSFMDDIMASLPEPDKVAGAICRVNLSYPRDWEALVDEARIAERFARSHSLQILKARHSDNRVRLGSAMAIEALNRQELLVKYWKSVGLDSQEIKRLQELADEILFEKSIE